MSADRPVVLDACSHDPGRSGAATVLTEQLAGDGVQVRSARPRGGAARFTRCAHGDGRSAT